MLKIVGSLILISTFIFGAVSITVDKNSLIAGDSVTFSIISNSENTIFPEISDIEGLPIEAVSSSQSIQIINGDKNVNISKNYTFYPNKSVVIPSFDVNVNGSIEKTQPIEIKVDKPTQTQDVNFILELQSNKSRVFVGEPIELTILFKRRSVVPIMDLNFKVENFDNFWTKPISGERQYVEGEYTVHELKYMIFPQKAGNISIEPIKLSVATPKAGRDVFGYMTQLPKWQSVFSNQLSFEITPLSENLKLIGDFKIEASIDKDVLSPNEPLNLTLKVVGYGNLDDLDDFKLDLPNLTVYEDKAVKNYQLENGKYKGEYIKKFAILSDRDFVITPFKLSYFDIDSKTKKDIQTQEFKISVQKKVQNEPILESKEQLQNSNTPQQQENKTEIIEKFIYLIIGVVIGLIASNYRMKMPDTKFKLRKNEREILMELMAKVDKSEETKEMIKKLEENIYEGKSNKIDRSKLKY